MVLGERLRHAFKEAGIPLAKVAEHIGISQTSLYTILKKDSFELEYLKKSADLLGIPTSTLLDESETPSKAVATTQTGYFNQAGNSNIQRIKGNKGNVQANTGTTINNIEDCRRDLVAAQKEVALLTSQLADKERIIQLLERSSK